MPRKLMLVWLLVVGGVSASLAAEGSGKHPVYVGARVCAECHHDQAAGHQFSLWRAGPHAKAYASLWSPESKQIAKLSGIPEEPQQAAMCLGCHATASQAEEWEKEKRFYLEDGIQCEYCHGPGSEYMPAEIMMDRAKAMANGLKMPGERECLMCHNTKGSHVAVLGSPELNIREAMMRIAHPVPDENPPANTQPAPSGGNRPTSEFKYVGVMNCAQCHKGPMMGYQFSRWRMSKHARAYAVLATKTGYEMAREMGVQGDPQRSDACLKCHRTGYGLSDESFLPSFYVGDGVGCEACHGPGSAYHPEAVMRDKKMAGQAGLLEVTERTCMPCHENAHGRTFDYKRAVGKIAHPTTLPKEHVKATGPRYKNPLNLAISPDGAELYVACEASDSVIVVDVATRRKVAEIGVGGQPNDVTFSPDGRKAYVTNRLDDSVGVIDVASRELAGVAPVGDEPHGLLFDEEGKRLYVLDTSSDGVSVLNPETLEREKLLLASRSPWSLAMSPDGERIAVTHTLSRFVPFREPSVAEVAIIDTRLGQITERIEVHGANLLAGVDWHPSGKYALITHNRTKNLVPMTRLLQGWTITNGVAVIWRDGRVDQVLLDEPGVCFPDPADVAISPDGKYAFVTSSGTNCVGVVDLEKLISMLEGASDYEREHVFPNHLGKPTEFVIKRIATEHSPRGVRFTADGKTAFVANCLDDSITVIDVDRLEAVERIDLGGPTEITKVRWGEQLFHSASVTFHRQFSCHTCHPDGHIDGLTYDIEPDGIGVAPVDNRTLRGILDTAPFKWEGTNPSLARQCGPRLAVFFTRIDPYTPSELAAVDNYICTIPRPPNRYRPVGGDLTPAQRRGKAIFERTHTNDGREIDIENRCVTCHFPPLYTDRSQRNVGTKMMYDRESVFDVPHLNNIYDSAPYLHNGISPTLEEIWTKYNPYDQHGVTNDMTKDELNDLIEYLKTL